VCSSDLLSHDNSKKVSLKPLDRAAQFSLLQDLLGLEPALAERVVSQSGGSPQFSIQLVGDWVQRGILRPSKNGFVLAPGVDASIPNSMLEIWRQRLTEMCTRYKDEDTHPLELAAMLGNDILREELVDAMALANVQPSNALLSELQRTRLVVHKPGADGWSFIHSLFRAAVLEYTEEKGRTQRWATICADVLESRPQSLARRAGFLVAADRTEEALDPLQAAALEQHSIGELGRSKFLIELRESILETFDVDPEGRHALGTELTRLITMNEVDRSQVLLSRGEELAAWAARLKEYDPLVRLKMGLGTARLNMGQHVEGVKLMTEALDIAGKNRLKLKFAVLNRMCFTHIRIGELDKAAGFAREAALTAESWGDSHGVASAYLNMARVNWQLDSLDAATFCLTEAAIRFERAGSRRGLAEVWNTRGEIARSRGDLNEAEIAYCEAYQRFDSCGTRQAEFAKLNLGNTYVAAGKFSEAMVLFNEVENAPKSANRIPLILFARLSKVPCLIHERDWETVEHELSTISPKLVEIGLVDRDLVTTAQSIVDACEAAGKMDLARKASAILVHQLETLGRTTESEEVS
jgi:tetratricopeptide (TPR) repeat protein